MTVRILTVGVNNPADYTDPAGLTYPFGALQGADDDAATLGDLYVAASGPVVIDRQPPITDTTTEVAATDVLHRITALSEASKPGDIVAIALAGHGLNIDNRFIYATNNDCITDSQLHDAYMHAHPGVTIVTVIDACHAAAARLLRPMGVPGTFRRNANAGATYANEQEATPSRISMFACTKAQAAYEAGRSDGYSGGAFTNALSEAWALQPASYREWFDNAYRLTPTNQAPRLVYNGPNPAELQLRPLQPIHQGGQDATG